MFVAVGLAAALAGVAVTALGLAGRHPGWGRSTRTLVVVMAAAAVAAVVVMERALITRDFTVKFVAENGSSTTPPVFNVATMWAALEGSILLWVLVLCGYVVSVVVRFRHRFDDPFLAWALLVMFVVCAFFFALMVGPAAPFVSVDPPPGYDGPGPNPLLQNHILMAFHPPILYLGYVGFTVPFAFAIAALATGRLGEDWLTVTRRWSVAAWGFLTLGIVLGAWWSYETLGWGGYWGWDPVENASLLPWITGTAYLHSVMVQQRRGLLRVWNLSLIIATFSLTILGTFLTRSGVLASVHAFTESGIGPTILAFFGVIVIASLALIGWRGGLLRSPDGRIGSPASREAAFLANNALFAAFAFIVLLGTIFPLIVEAVDGRTVSVGAPYFEQMTRPVGLALLFLMAVAPVLPWGYRSTHAEGHDRSRRGVGGLLSRRLLGPAWVAALVLVFAVVVAGARGWAPLLAFGLGGFAGGTALRHLALGVRRKGVRALVGSSGGGMITHIGVVMVGVALAASGSYVRQAEFSMVPQQTASFAGHQITYEGSRLVEHPNRLEREALVRIDDTKTYAPAVAVYPFASQTIGIPSVRSTLRDDVALSVVSFPESSDSGTSPAGAFDGTDGAFAASGPEDRVVLRVTVQPMVAWLWLGGLVMALGTLLSLVPPRRRNFKRPSRGGAERVDGLAEERGSPRASVVAP